MSDNSGIGDSVLHWLSGRYAEVHISRLICKNISIIMLVKKDSNIHLKVLVYHNGYFQAPRLTISPLTKSFYLNCLPNMTANPILVFGSELFDKPFRCMGHAAIV